jgi:hypothetical protein
MPASGLVAPDISRSARRRPRPFSQPSTLCRHGSAVKEDGCKQVPCHFDAHTRDLNYEQAGYKGEEMKKLIALAGLILASTTFAQTWGVADGKLTLIGCYGRQDGVYCDLSYTLTSKQTSRFYWAASRFKIYRQDGVSQEADSVAFIDGKFGGDSSYQEIISNVPVKVQIYFNVPNSTSGFRAIAFADIRFDNIPVRPYGTAPKTPVQLPAGPSVSGFAISLSNCQLQEQNYVCVATLTPTK